MPEYENRQEQRQEQESNDLSKASFGDRVSEQQAGLMDRGDSQVESNAATQPEKRDVQQDNAELLDRGSGAENRQMASDQSQERGSGVTDVDNVMQQRAEAPRSMSDNSDNSGEKKPETLADVSGPQIDRQAEQEQNRRQ